MTHKQLKEQIQGSILKEQFLEAFLMQSAYIESLIKLYADFEFFKLLKEKIENKIPMADVMREKIERYGLYDLIEFLYKSDLITKEERKALDKYRTKRNKIFHNLLREISTKEPEKELESACKDGEQILKVEKFKITGELFDFLEKPRLRRVGETLSK